MKEVRLRKHDIEVLAALKAFIDSVPDEVLTIAQLSKRFGINTDKLKKGFRQVYGLAPYRYVLTLRIERAKFLLCEMELSVADIAMQLGYEYPENFSAWFRKETGIRPLQWRYKIHIAPTGKNL